jgi:hypothetical protein
MDVNVLVYAFRTDTPEHAAYHAWLTTTGHLVLSGLLGTDVPSILAEYRPRLPGHRAEVYPRGEWRAVEFSQA